MRILLIAGFSESILLFRGALIESMLRRGHQVHVAAPELAAGNSIRDVLRSKGVVAHDLQLKRTGMITPIATLSGVIGSRPVIGSTHAQGFKGHGSAVYRNSVLHRIKDGGVFGGRLRVHDAPKGKDEVMSRDGRAVGPFMALTDDERPGETVVADA